MSRDTMLISTLVKISGEPKTMLTWNHTEVLEWLKDNTDEKTACLIGGQGYTGEQWVNVTVQDLEKIIPKRKVCERLIEDRDEFVDSESQTVEKFLQQGLHGGGTEQTEFVEPFGEFDRPVDIIESCRQYNKYPTSGSRPTDLIEPFRRFVPLKEVFTKGSNFDKFAAEVISFGAACLNECTNGVIYFGVEELKKVGVTVACDQLLLDKCLTQRIVKSFHESQVDKVLKCIRPIRWVPVVCENASGERYIIEISVNPAHELCEDEVFLVNCSKHLYKFDETGCPSVISKSKWGDIFKGQEKLARLRKQKESDSRQRAKRQNSAHRDKLVDLLCRGKSKFRQSSSPILVLPPAGSDLDSDYVEETFSFLSNIKWKAVLDFGDDRKFLDTISKQDRLFKNRKVTKFDTDLGDPSAVRNTKEDAYSGHVPYWIFMNGDADTKWNPENLQNWKKDLEDAFRSCSKMYTKGNKVLIVFLLHSHVTPVYVEACAQLCLQSENFVCIVQDDTIGKAWQAEITRRDYVDKKRVSEQTVSGLSWNYVGEIVKEITSDEPQTCCQVQTNEGEKVLTIKKELCDLHILGFNECENVKITDELLQQKEIEFYKGGKVDWFNFHLRGVCERDILHPLEDKVKSALDTIETVEYAIEKEITEGIIRITLYHQPGSGGTTCARHVLWKFRKKFKCAEITHYTENTCVQIAQLKDFGESPKKDQLPLLLLIDNLDSEKLAELLTNLRKQAKRDRNESRSKVYCVCLTVESRSNLPKDVAGKSDPFECLRQKLSDGEEYWFEKQSENLQKRKLAGHTLVAFNIMKENFDEAFINKTVGDLIRDIPCNKEKFLLKYLAFLNFYDVGQRVVQFREFTDIMDDVDIDWADDFSDALNVLVSQEIGDNTHLCVKISHPLLSGEILKVLRKGEEKLSEFTKKFLNNKYIGIGTHPVKNLREHLAAIVKERAKKGEEGNREPFSPLILAIMKNEDWTEAASVLHLVYDKTGDFFVAQHLARLHIEYKSWASALEYASEAAEKGRNNYHLLDTKGQVYRCKLEAQYESTKNDSIDVSKALDIVKEAQDGITIFKQVQRLSQMNPINRETRPTISGQLGCLQVYASLLQNLALLPVFSPTRLREFLHGGYVPEELESWRRQGDYIDFLQNIPRDVMETVRYMEDFHSHFFLYSYSDKEFGREKHAVISLKNRLAKVICRRHKSSRRATSEHRKNDSWLLGVPNLSSILEELKTMGQHEKQQQEQYLRTLLDDAQECLKREPKNFDYMEYFLSTTLMISCYFDQTDLFTQISYEEAKRWSHRLYTSRMIKPKQIEPYMYYVMFHWPKARDHQGKKEVSDAISAWKRIYSERFANRDAMRAFLFAKGTEFGSFVHAQQLLTQKHRHAKLWKEKDVIERLRRFTGTLHEDGKAVYVQDDRESILSIQTADQFLDSNLFGSRVTFVIAITYMGPKAYDVQRE